MGQKHPERRYKNRWGSSLERIWDNTDTVLKTSNTVGDLILITDGRLGIDGGVFRTSNMAGENSLF
jgi:hypothetical protein